MTKRLITILSLLFFIVICGVLAWRQHLRNTIVPAYEKQLWNIAVARADEINKLLTEQEKNASTLAQEPFIINALESLHNKTQTLESLSEELLSRITPHKDLMEFDNIILVDSSSAIIVSTTKKMSPGEQLIKNNHPHSALGESYERARMTFTNDFSDFAFNDALKETALFITIPMIKEKKYIGALIYHVDKEKIFIITQQYIGLEKTGEIVLGKREGNYNVFVAGTRHDSNLAFKKQTFSATFLAQQGTGTFIDYREKKVVGAWTFVPKVDWELIVKIDREEINRPISNNSILLICIIILFLISISISIYCNRVYIARNLHHINTHYPCNKIPAFIKHPLFIAFLIALCFMLKNGFQCMQKKSSMISCAKKQTVESTTRNVDAIETLLNKIAFTGQSIANDLRTSYLAKEDITTRIKRDIMENNLITNITVLFSPYAYDTKTKLYGHAIAKTNDAYQEEQVKEALFNNSWYTDSLKNGSTWVTNAISETQPTLTGTYSVTFFNEKNEPQGVVAITYSLQAILQATESTTIGQTGYSIVIDADGMFIFHPIQTLVENEWTLLQFAQSNGNEELASIAQKVMNEKPVLASYASETTKSLYWIYTHPIAINKWVVGTIFSEDEIGLAAHIVRHYYFKILLWLVITLLLLGALMCARAIISTSLYAVIANVILLSALIISWYIISTTPINKEARTIIVDQSSLNKFLNDLKEETLRRHEPEPINIPVGLLLYSLSVLDADHISIAGYFWNKYNSTLHKSITRGLDMPQATRVFFGKPLNSTLDQVETETWSEQAVLFHDQHYQLYPFDKQQLRIILEHRDIEKNIVLTPDLNDYKNISPESLPGLDKNLAVAGFTIEQSFFEYQKIAPTVNFGFKEYSKVTEHFQLIYTVVMNRNLLNPFVLYILPLLVILFTLFCTLLLIGGKISDPIAAFGPYTGLFFSLIVLQRSLREQQPAGTTLYMEYAFFCTYITIILLILHTILTNYYKNWHGYSEQAFKMIKLLFWPFQFTAWLITTVIIFY